MSPSARLSGTAAILGGMVWVIFWTFHTLAHGPTNPAPTDGTFVGRTALEHARLMMLTSPPLLLLGLAGVYHRLGSHAGAVGRAVTALIAISLTAMVLVSTGVGPWALYAVSIIVLLLGLLLLGIAMLRVHDFPRWSRGVPLGIALTLPLLVLARAPGSPLLGLGDIVGYLLLEGVGAVFGFGWIALGLALRSVEPVEG